ncbi:MAG TPA: superoxide dismutase family protein [Vicinamibacterales bacterium]|jgi:Cu-Zn family superoxide dismutase|nr:superoxide dismutase family protein [Vicinamibacterales bacterium]
MTRTVTVVVTILAASALTLSAQMTHVTLKDAQGKEVGMVMLSPASGGGVTVAYDFKGLPPGEHALHIHQVAKCEPPFATAGPHFNPAGKKHGTQNPEGPHAGDMPNFTVAANGMAKGSVTNKTVSMGADANSVFAGGGTAIVVHAAADDMKTDPSGNAGDRIACGVVVK